MSYTCIVTEPVYLVKLLLFGDLWVLLGISAAVRCLLAFKEVLLVLQGIHSVPDHLESPVLRPGLCKPPPFHYSSSSDSSRALSVRARSSVLCEPSAVDPEGMPVMHPEGWVHLVDVGEGQWMQEAADIVAKHAEQEQQEQEEQEALKELCLCQGEELRVSARKGEMEACSLSAEETSELDAVSGATALMFQAVECTTAQQ